MRQYKKVRRSKTVEELVKITCNFCGAEINHEFHPVAPRRAAPRKSCIHGGSFNVAFGYPSNYDLHDYEFDVCDKCFEKRFLPFAPHVTNVSAWGERLSK